MSTRHDHHRLIGVVGVSLAAFALAACGSEVAPEDFVGAGGAGTGTTGLTSQDPGVTGDSSGGTSTDTSGTGATDNSGTGSTYTGTGGSTGAGGGGTGSGTGADAGGSGGGAPTLPGTKAGSCDGFKNGTGITDDTITVATIADISGPVANQFKAAHDGMNAFVTYFNATYPNGICGRKLKVEPLDSAISANGSAEASRKACQDAFALVGSISGFDSGGVQDTVACGQPDIRNQATERARQDAPTTFQIVPLDVDHMFLQQFVWAKQKFGNNVGAKSAFVYLNAGAGVDVAKNTMKGAEKLGFKWTRVIAVDLTSVPNWNQYANELKAAGITFVGTLLAPYSPKFTAALKQADFHPPVILDGSVYDQKFTQGQDAIDLDGSYLYSQTSLLEEANRVPEMATYQTWLQRTGGGAPTYTGAESWAAGRLFTQLAIKLGGKLTRASLINELKGVKHYTGSGIVDPGDVGGGTTAPCLSMMQMKSAKWVRISPFPFQCGPLG